MASPPNRSKRNRDPCRFETDSTSFASPWGYWSARMAQARHEPKASCYSLHESMELRQTEAGQALASMPSRDNTHERETFRRTLGLSSTAPAAIPRGSSQPTPQRSQLSLHPLWKSKAAIHGGPKTQFSRDILGPRPPSLPSFCRPFYDCASRCWTLENSLIREGG